MSCVLVTGAAGFIGQALVRRLLGNGIVGRHVHRLVLSDLSLNIDLQDPRLVFEAGSSADRAVLRRLVGQRPDTIFHLASVPGAATERDPTLGRSVNEEVYGGSSATPNRREVTCSG